MTATATDRFVVEHFDGLRSSDPRVREHLALVRRMDAIALAHGERSYVIPDACPGCLWIVAAYEAQEATA